MSWISVEDRLPDGPQRVLVNTKNVVGLFVDWLEIGMNLMCLFQFDGDVLMILIFI